MDISVMAVSLYDGGWRSGDKDWLKSEYNLTDEETDNLCNQLAEIENI